MKKRKFKKKLFELVCNKVTFFILLCGLYFAFVILGVKYFIPIIFPPKLFLSPVPLNESSISVAYNTKQTISISDTLSLLRKSNIKYSTVSSDDIAFSFKLVSGEEVMFSKSKDLRQQVASLQLVLSRLTIEGKTIKKLDFRYDKPVLIF